MGTLHLSRNGDRSLDERGGGRRPVAVAVPDHYQHAGRHTLGQLAEPHSRVRLVDREQRRKGEAKPRDDHRLNGAVVVRAEHDAWPHPSPTKELLSDVLVLAVLVTDHGQPV